MGQALIDPFFQQSNELIQQGGDNAQDDDGGDDQSHLKEVRPHTDTITYRWFR